MRIRLTWIAALLALMTIGMVLACSTKYSSSNNGLVVVPSQGGEVIDGQGGPVMETFSLTLANGHMSQINNVNGPPTPGLPTSVVLDPAGAFAYVIVYQNPIVSGGGVTGVASFQIASDGKLGPGTTQGLNPSTMATAFCVFTQNGKTVTQDIPVTVNAPVTPTSMVIDSAGQLLFVTDVATSAQATYTCNGSSVTAEVPVPGAVSVFAVSDGTLSEVAGSPFPLPLPSGGQNPSASALAVTPTIYPTLYAPCSGFAVPTTENLYVTDVVNYLVLNYSVSSSGSLELTEPSPGVSGVPTGTAPDGVTVDPCNRFVYVANGGPSNNGNTVSAYTICSTLSQPNCQAPDFSLLPAKGSPFTISPGDGPGPLAVDAYGGFLYVVDTASNVVSGFRISPSTGSLTPLTPPAVAAGLGANSIAIRSDDSWMFVANLTAGTLSQYAITPGTGALTPQQPISTFNYPSGVAVK
jgi:6-phosphogluconolactonase (cycloisomerase 2 family)